MSDAKKEQLEARYAKLRAAQFAEAKEVTVAELLKDGAAAQRLLVDVRTDEERRVSTIPGAVSRAEAEARLRSGALPAGVPVTCFCTIGLRSGLAAQALSRQVPEREVSNLARGVLGWTHEGGGAPFVTPDGVETRRVHTYSADWAMQAAGYEAVTERRGGGVFGALAGVAGLARDKFRGAFGL